MMPATPFLVPLLAWTSTVSQRLAPIRSSRPVATIAWGDVTPPSPSPIVGLNKVSDQFKTALASGMGKTTVLERQVSELRAENARLARQLQVKDARAVVLEIDAIDERREKEALATALRRTSANYNFMPFAHYLSLFVAHGKTTWHAAIVDARWNLTRQLRRAKYARGTALLACLIWQIRVAKALKRVSTSAKDAATRLLVAVRLADNDANEQSQDTSNAA